ncbi:MAG TPA: hypothetical protein VM032_19755 [Vicinamibacterales bacterium]|nr:hypothetical protein [Vicinamibacterales bacterium]
MRELEDLARHLPACDQAAKLHALIARLAEAASSGESLAPVADALASAASEALVHDPWVRFEAAARRLKAGHPLAPDSLTPDFMHEREANGQRNSQIPPD